MAWNIQGLEKKLNNISFRKFCEKFKIFAFSEIWSCKQSVIESAFPEFHVFFSPRAQRLKGGVAVCVHKSISCHVTQLLKSAEDNVFLKLGKSVLKSSVDILAAFVYVAPERSVVYDQDNRDGIESLENCMSEIMCEYPDLPWLLCGDFNARMHGLSDCDFEDGNRHVPPLQDLENLTEVPQSVRKSKDTGVNSFGRKLIELCKSNGLFIVNGRTPSDQEGEITCVANRGKSVVDYCICSKSVFDFVTDMYVVDRCESDHFPIVTTFSCQSEEVDEEDDEMLLEDGVRFVWKERYAESFDAFIRENEHVEYQKFLSALDRSVEAGSTCLVSFIQSAADKMRSKQKAQESRAQPPWWDEDCERAKQNKYTQLKTFRRTNSHEDLQKYLDLKKDMKKLCKKKQTEHNERILKELNDACNDSNSKSFWQKLKSLTANKANGSNGISPRAWYEYFRNLLSIECASADSSFDQDVENVISNHDSSSCGNCSNAEMDKEISESEILDAIKSMKKAKAPGPDGIPVDFFQHASIIFVKFLHPLFNRVFTSGKYPESWTKAVIFPLHKKGNPRRVDNYRGISLLNIISKLYSIIINNRLNHFCEENDSIPEAQAGFRKGYSTTDNIFSLQAMVQKYLTKHGGRFYTLFVDFSKAYDCVQRMKLLYLLLQKGVHGKMFQTLQSMYEHVKAAVRVGNQVTDYFDCMSGVRQGCVLSPLLFSIFLSELEADLSSCGARGIDIFSEPLGVFLLMYADDIALVSDSVADLQKKITCLEQYCKKWGLSVNMDKTKVVVFKNGGFLKNCEKWYFAGKPIQVETSYNYLGVIFSTTLNWSRCIENLSGKALRAVAGIKRLYFKLQNLPADTMFKIFDVKVKPILLYGSEVWGFHRLDEIEKVHTKICKMILGAGRDVKNSVALGECGRFPVRIDVHVRIIKYWCKLLLMPDSRYPKQCYRMLYLHDKSGRANWVTRVRTLLCTHGFGYVWEMQTVGNMSYFITTFKTRLMDSYRQEWHDSLLSYPDYCDYHPEILRASYIAQLNAFEHRRAICLLRCNRLPLNGISRFGKPITDPFCKECDGQCIEDLCHFMLVCPRYTALRQKYIPIYYYRFPSNFKVSLLCRNLNDKLVLKVALYVSECLKIRK